MCEMRFSSGVSIAKSIIQNRVGKILRKQDQCPSAISEHHGLVNFVDCSLSAAPRPPPGTHPSALELKQDNRASVS